MAVATAQRAGLALAQRDLGISFGSIDPRPIDSGDLDGDGFGGLLLAQQGGISKTLSFVGITTRSTPTPTPTTRVGPETPVVCRIFTRSKLGRSFSIAFRAVVRSDVAACQP